MHALLVRRLVVHTQAVVHPALTHMKSRRDVCDLCMCVTCVCVCARALAQRSWMESVLDERLPEEESLVDLCRSGAILCRLVNALCDLHEPRIENIVKYGPPVSPFLSRCLAHSRPPMCVGAMASSETQPTHSTRRTVPPGVRSFLHTGSTTPK